MNEPLEPMDEDLASALGALRGGDMDVPAGVEDRLLARIAQSAAGPVSSPTAPSPVPSASPGAPWWMVPAAFILGAAVGAFVWQAVTPPPAPETIVREVIIEVAPDAGPDAPAPAALDAGPPTLVVPEPSVPLHLDDEAEAAPEVVRAAERSLLMRAQVALTRSLPSDALSALSEHRARFPRGQLVEEREALWVQALAASGDSRSSAAAVSFLARYPDSIFREAVESIR